MTIPLLRERREREIDAHRQAISGIINAAIEKAGARMAMAVDGRDNIAAATAEIGSLFDLVFPGEPESGLITQLLASLFDRGFAAAQLLDVDGLMDGAE